MNQSITPQSVYPLPMTIVSLLMSLFGVFGNGLILCAIISTKALHNRCNVLIGTLAFSDFISCIYFVELRFIILANGFFWTNAKCYLWSTYGLFAMNVQSGMGLALGIDRFLAIAKPIKYRSWESKTYIAIVLCPVLVYGFVVTAVGYQQSTPFQTVAVCFPPNAYVFMGRTLWIGSNVVIVGFVLLAYGTAQYKIRRAANASSSSDGNVASTRRLLDSLTCIMIVYSGTWALNILALVVIQVFIPGTDLSKTIQLHLTWLVLTNADSSVVIYAWRAQDYRRAFVRILTCGRFVYNNGVKKTATVNISSKLSASQMSLQNNRKASVVSVRIPSCRLD